jgi:hypothetical protein
VHEFFAQAFAFVWVIQHQKELLDDFRALSRQQPVVYRTWEALDALTQNKVAPEVIRDSLQAQFLALMQAGQRFFPEPWNMHLIRDVDS